MPVIDGQVVRSRWTAFKMGELSSVDRPAQPGALALIMKRAPDMPPAIAGDVAKYVCEDDGAHTFTEVLAANNFDEKIWPMTNALSQAIRSIMGDRTIQQADREAKVTQSVADFLAAVRNLSPTAAVEAEKKLAELISKRNPNMHTIESLTAKVNELTGQLSSATTLAQTEKARADAAEKAKTDADAKAKEMADELDKTKKSLVEATDETLKVEGRDVKKSAVGEDSFAVFKSLDERARTADAEKRAGEEFPHLVGTNAEKALVLKARDALPEPAQKALDAILTSAEKMAAGGFARMGSGSGPVTADAAKAVATFEGKVSEIEKRDNVTKSAAMSKARKEFPEEFDAYQEAKAA